MGARQKLNVAYGQGGLIVAALVGLLARSWAVFAAMCAVLIGLGLLGGEIRPRRTPTSASAPAPPARPPATPRPSCSGSSAADTAATTSDPSRQASPAP